MYVYRVPTFVFDLMHGGNKIEISIFIVPSISPAKKGSQCCWDGNEAFRVSCVSQPVGEQKWRIDWQVKSECVRRRCVDNLSSKRDVFQFPYNPKKVPQPRFDGGQCPPEASIKYFSPL